MKLTTINGGIAVAFQTRRIEFLRMEIRRLRALETLTGEEKENVLNALEMATTELWQMIDAVTALNGVTDDMLNALHGAEKLADLSRSIGKAAHAGEDLPLDPDELRAHFKKRQKEEGG